jgi:hypothetical protein
MRELAKLLEPDVRIRAERLCQPLDGREPVRLSGLTRTREGVVLLEAPTKSQL